MHQPPKTCVHLVPFPGNYDRIYYSVLLSKRSGNYRITSQKTISNNNFIAGHIWRSRIGWETHNPRFLGEWEKIQYTEAWDLGRYSTTQFAHDRMTHVCRIEDPVPQLDAEGKFELTDYQPNTDSFVPTKEIYTWAAKFQWVCNGTNYIRDGEWHVYDVSFNGRKVLPDE